MEANTCTAIHHQGYVQTICFNMLGGNNWTGHSENTSTLKQLQQIFYVHLRGHIDLDLTLTSIRQDVSQCSSISALHQWVSLECLQDWHSWKRSGTAGIHLLIFWFKGENIATVKSWQSMLFYLEILIFKLFIRLSNQTTTTAFN